MSYRYERHYQRRRRGRGCLIALVALVWIVLLGVLAYRYWVRPQISQYIGQRIAEQLGENGPGQAGQQAQPGAQLPLSTAIAALPSGELRITEAQANAYLAEHADALRPIDTARVRFVPGEIQADLGAYGTTSTARVELAVQNGRIIAVDPQLDGPLSQAIALPDLTTSLEQRLNNQLAAQGRRVTDVRVEQGALIITIEG
jgi:hypothetical protein